MAIRFWDWASAPSGFVLSSCPSLFLQSVVFFVVAWPMHISTLWLPHQASHPSWLVAELVLCRRGPCFFFSALLCILSVFWIFIFSGPLVSASCVSFSFFSNTAVTSTAAQTQPSSQIQASRDRSSPPPTQQPHPSPVHSLWPANSPPWVLGLRFRVGGLVLNAWSLGEVMGFEGVGLAYWLLFNMVLLLGCPSRFQHASAGRFTISCRPSGDVVM